MTLYAQEKDTITLDSLLIDSELRFQDSINQLNRANKKLNDSRSAFTLGVELFKLKDYSEALKKFTLAIDIDSLFIQAYINRGKTHFYLNDNNAAISDFEKCFSLDSTELTALYEIATIYKKEDKELAFGMYDKILAINQNEYIALYEQGVLLFTDNNFEDAVDLFTKSIGIYKSSRTYNDRASCYRKLQKYDKAISDYMNAITLNTDLPFIYNNLASTYRKSEDLEKALGYYNLAIEKDSNYFLAYNNRGSLYIELNDLDKAIIDVNRALQIHTDYALAYNNRGIINHLLEKYKEAISDFDQALLLKEDYAKAYLNRAISRQMIRDVDGACDDWEKARLLGIKVAEKYLINDCK